MKEYAVRTVNCTRVVALVRIQNADGVVQEAGADTVLFGAIGHNPKRINMFTF